MNNMKVVCINDSNRPNEIPNSLWIKKGRFYDVERITRDMSGNYAIVLVSPKLGRENMPYRFFGAYRFSMVDPELVAESENVVSELMSEVLA